LKPLKRSCGFWRRRHRRSVQL